MATLVGAGNPALDLGALADFDDDEALYYQTPERSGRTFQLKIAHPRWLAGTLACCVALVAVVTPVLGHGIGSGQPRRLVLSGYSSSGAADAAASPEAPSIDVTSQAQPDAAPPASGQAYSLQGAPSISVQQIEAVLQKYGSPAVGRGQALYDMGVRYGIDPAYALAFFVHESGCGTKGVARFTHSLGNIRWTPGFDNYEGYRSYSTWEQGIDDWYKLITELYIQGWGLRTVDAIIPRYAPYADNNNPPAYIASIKSMVDSWHGK